MFILGFESTAKSASVALLRDGALVAEAFQNSALTHSKTLLPMAEDMLKNCDINFDEIDVFAVSHGPGSFTGIRIGVSCVKGLCWALEKPAVGVSTLEAMAYGAALSPEGTLICCAMDARRNEVYNALFTFCNGELKRLCPDRALALEALKKELCERSEPIVIIGDGAKLCYDYVKDKIENVRIAPQALQHQRASGVCLAAQCHEPKSAEHLLPVYLRLSQAERERLEKNK